jgi:DNA-binding NarL/FixJ family response regulator
MYDERRPGDAFGALRLGFDGAIVRDASAREVSAALVAVAAGHFVFSRAALLGSAATGEPEAEREIHEPLTEREIEVLRLISSGKSNKAIGVALNVSEHTAKFHVGSILSKLGVETRTDAVRVGIKLGLIPL